MDRKKSIKYALIICPSILFLICVYTLPIHESVMLLLIPFIPFLVFCDACFYTMPCAILILALWCLAAFFMLFSVRGRKIVKRMKYVPLVLIAVVILGYISTEITNFLADAHLPIIGLGVID